MGDSTVMSETEGLILAQASTEKQVNKSPDNDKTENDAEAKLKFSELPSRSKTTLALLALANFFAGCGFSLLAPFFPQEADKKNVSNTVQGLIFSSFEFFIFLSSPVFGNYLTSVGAKFMFFSGIFVGGTCAILFGLLDRSPPGTVFVVICFCCRAVEALGLSAFITASFAIVSSEFPKHVATVFGIMETASGMGLMIGPALGGGLYELGGFGLPFYVIGALILLNGLVLLKLLPEPQETKKERKGTVFSLLLSPVVWLAMISILVGAMSISFLDPTLSKHLKKFDLSTPVIGLVFVITPGLYAFTSPVWGYITDKWDIKGFLIVFGNLVCGLSFLFIGPSPWLAFLPFELWVNIIGLVMLGLCIGGAIIPTMKCLVQGAISLGFEDTLDTYGIVSGLFNSLFCLGAFLGPTLGGILVEKFGFRYASTVITGIFFFAMLVSAVSFSVLHLRKKTKEVNASVEYEKLNGTDHASESPSVTESVNVVIETQDGRRS